MFGPLGAHASRVDANDDAGTFFAGSILFTLGGLTQYWLARPERDVAGSGTSAWPAAWVQSVGTFLLNFMTFEAIGVTVSSAPYNLLVWLRGALASVRFLISGACLYVSAPRQGYMPAVASWPVGAAPNGLGWCRSARRRSPAWSSRRRDAC